MAGYSGTPLRRTLGVADVTEAAVDDVWSGLPFVRRLRDRS